MDQLPDALEAAIGPRPDDLDLPTLHRRARARRTGHRAMVLTGVLGLVAVTGLGLAAATGGGGSEAQLTASEGGPDGASAVPAADPCGPVTTTIVKPIADLETTTTTTADTAFTVEPAPALPTTTTTAPITAGGDPSAAPGNAPPTTTTTVTTPSTATGAAGPDMEATGSSGATTATTVQPNPSLTEGTFEPFVTTSTTDPADPDAPEAPETTETTTTVTCAPAPATTQVPGTTMLTPSTVPAPPVPSPTPGAGLVRLAGSFSGEGPVLDPKPQGCAQMHHSLNATATVSGGSGWKLSERYCGANDGTTWSGEGTFRFDDQAGNTFGGTFTSRASVPTTGEPYELTITGGTGNYVGATGTCAIDNHIEDTGPGRTRQYGTFTCDLAS